MHVDHAAEIRTEIRVQIAVLPRTVFRAFAGRGIRKRCQLDLVDTLLEAFIPRLHHPFVYRRPDGQTVSVEELGQVVKAAVLSIDDATVAEAAAGATQDDRDAARAAMAEVIAAAIEARWKIAKKPPARLVNY